MIATESGKSLSKHIWKCVYPEATPQFIRTSLMEPNYRKFLNYKYKHINKTTLIGDFSTT